MRILILLMLFASGLNAQTYQDFGSPAHHVIKGFSGNYYTTAFDISAKFDSKGRFQWVEYKTAALEQSHTPIMHGTKVREGLWQQIYTSSEGTVVKLSFEIFGNGSWYYRVYHRKNDGKWKVVDHQTFMSL